MKTSHLLLLALYCLLSARYASATTPERDDFNTYSKVKVHVRSADDLRILQQKGIDIDHYQGKTGRGIEIVINQNELRLLETTAFSFEVLVPDVGALCESLPPPTDQELVSSYRLLELDGITGFGYGSMGGFYTYNEVVQRLDSMVLQYPSLITPKFSIGTSPEGRTIWAVEISDNPGTVEPGEPVAYYDALHHAREPMSMATLMYFMYWLLDNYGTNPEATYLVNNRRLCFVPVVNPDGYAYNQSTNPNGGGGWRKNRSYNFDGSRGVDLNRNYGFQWGYDDVGSSPTPSSEIYRGPSPESESETRAVRDYALLIQPSMAFTTHSVAGRYLNPYGYRDTVVAYEYYAEFAGDFSDKNKYLYGTVFQMLDYNSNGTTRDFLHNIGCYAWTPEVGGSGFWPAQSEIIPIAQENLIACKYLAWVSGAFADYQSFSLVGKPYVLPGDTISLAVRVRNKGLTLAAENVHVSVQPLTPGIVPLTTGISLPPIPPRGEARNDSTTFMFVAPTTVLTGGQLTFVSTVRQEGIVMSTDTFSVVVGYASALFSDDAESGISSWTRSGTGTPWDTAFTMASTGLRSFADSRYGNVANNSNNQFTLSSQVSLSGTQNPRLEYYARWANEQDFDYVRVQLSTNNGGSWTTLGGKYTTAVGGQPAYTGNKGSWAWESINLNSYIGRQVKVRFTLTTDSGLRGDGFYFDDLRIVDYRDTTFTGVSEVSGGPFEFSLAQNYPNPFNPVTTLQFSIGKGQFTVLKVYDMLGQEVATPVNGELVPGSHTVSFDGTNLAGGVYFYRLTSGDFSSTRKLLLVK